LLYLFASSADARNEFLADAYGIASEDGLPSRESFAAMVAVHDSDDEFQYPAVEGRLGERDRARLSKLIFDRDREAATIDEGRGALDALRRQSWERRYRAVRKAISESEQSGDRAATIALLTDKVDLERKLGMLGAGNR
jgi:hypothetical protein